jgi:hypothetical protein
MNIKTLGEKKGSINSVLSITARVPIENSLAVA